MEQKENTPLKPPFSNIKDQFFEKNGEKFNVEQKKLIEKLLFEIQQDKNNELEQVKKRSHSKSAPQVLKLSQEVKEKSLEINEPELRKDMNEAMQRLNLALQRIEILESRNKDLVEENNNLKQKIKSLENSTEIKSNERRVSFRGK